MAPNDNAEATPPAVGFISDLSHSVLIVDDEESSRQAASMILQKLYHVTLAESAESALDLLQQKEYDLVLMDLQMPGMGGIHGLRAIRSKYSHLPVIIMTAYQTVSTAVEAMKIGASDYLVKPFDVPTLRRVVASNLGSSHTQQLRVCGELRGKSRIMQSLFATITQVADKDVTILITGESGTGKELIADAVHKHSSRRDQPFVVVNCAAIPENLIESELFGHERGAFTSADKRRLGQFECAHGGTLFLDEIGELSLSMQSKLLRVLQHRAFNRVGGNEEIRVDVRIIAATNRDLEQDVKHGRFREDLFYRLNVLRLEAPALRHRREDIAPLAEYFLSRFTREAKKPPKKLGSDVIQALEGYSWPGNVRELVNFMERVAVLSRQIEVLTSDLPDQIVQATLSPQEMVLDLGQFRSDHPFNDAVNALEGKLIRSALKRAKGVQTSAANLLGISRRILKYKMDKLGIQDSP